MRDGLRANRAGAGAFGGLENLARGTYKEAWPLRGDWPKTADRNKPEALVAAEGEEFLKAVRLENNLYIEFTVQNR